MSGEWRWPLLLPPLAAAMIAWTWLAWPDLLVDFGREAYVPWRLSQGAVLYRDVAYFTGPLSPYLNAAWFGLVGPGLDRLYAINAAWLVVLCGLLYGLLRGVARPAGATLALALFLTLFAFAQFVRIGNYNYLAPYSHELTHGLVFALAVPACLAAWAAGRSPAWLGLAGLCLGAAFLTRAEIFLAGLAGVLAWAAALRLAGAPVRVGPAAAALVAGCLLPPLVAWLALARALPPGEALAGVLGAWPAVLGGPVPVSPFYLRGMGLDDPVGNLAALGAWAVGAAALLGAAAGLDRRLGRESPAARWAPVAVGAGVLAAALALFGTIPWKQAPRLLPLAMGALAVHLVWRLVSLRSAGGADGSDEAAAEARRLALALSLTALAGVLLAKMALHARIVQYGFVLAMPATLLASVALVDWIPRGLRARGSSGRVFAAAALALLAVIAGTHLRLMQHELEHKTFWLEVGDERLRTDPLRGSQVARALEQLSGDEGDLVVLPEGVMLNFLLRRPNPTRYINFMPPELMIFGESRILDGLASSPPDSIVLVHKDTSEYGVPFFGRDYGVALMDWVREHYRPAVRIGRPPFRRVEDFGILLLDPDDEGGAP